MIQEQAQKPNQEQTNNLLKEIYYNPLGGFQSVDKLHRKAKEQNAKVTLYSLKKF